MRVRVLPSSPSTLLVGRPVGDSVRRKLVLLSVDDAVRWEIERGRGGGRERKRDRGG